MASSYNTGSGEASSIDRTPSETRSTTGETSLPAAGRELLEQLHDAVLVLDETGQIQYATGATERHLDDSPAALREEDAFELVAPADRDRARSRFETLVTDPSVDTNRVEFRLADENGPIWLEATGVDATDEAIDGYVVTTRDVTAQRAREHDLERLHDAANELYAAESREVCYQITIDTAVTILGFDWCTLAAPADGDDVFEIVAISEQGPLEVGDQPFSTDEGIAGHVFQTKKSTITTDATATDRGAPTDDAIRSAVTVPVGDWGVFQAVATERDGFDEIDRDRAELLVTSMLTAIERIERRQDLERQNERLDNFVRFVSHDLRTPLTTATGYLDLATESIDDDVPELEQVSHAHDRLETILEQLSTWAQGDDLLRDETPLALEEAVDRAWSTVAPSAATIDIDTDRTVLADRNCLQQVLENVFANALDHGGADVTVTVTDLEDGFAIEDDGPGIPPDRRDDVFDPGVTSDAAGTGLGLAIVDEIVAAHGWEIAVTDGRDGGARFEITAVSVAND